MSATQAKRFFLNIEQSITGQCWIDPLDDAAAALAIAQRHDLPEILGRLLAARRVPIDDVENYLAPTLRTLMPDPLSLRDMDVAISRISQALANKEKIVIFGDYDVDGATSCALLCRYFNALGLEVETYIPDRISEGYGPSEQAFEKLAADGATLIITVDCGIAAHSPIQAVIKTGTDVVIVDHHLAGEELPNATAVINPNREDDLSGLGALSAAGLVYLLIVGLNRHLRDTGWFSQTGSEPDLLQWLDLVALSTICDVVPLRDLNRAFVAQGLKIMAQRGNPGLAALSDVAGLKRKPDTQALGFLLGPRINAGGRLGASDIGAMLLSVDDKSRAAKLASELERLNKKRQLIEEEVLAPALREAEHAMGQQGNLNALVVSGSNWHVGVLGIVASRLKERFNRPAFVIGFDKQGQGVGSARSVPGVDLGAAVQAARDAGLLLKGGGHAMAAGLTIEQSKLGDFRAFLQDALTADTARIDRAPQLAIDGALSARGANLDLIDLIEKAGPYGAGNREPCFAFPAHRVVYADYVGAGHVRCTLVSGDGSRLKGIAFRAADSPLGEALINEQHAALHIAGTLARDDWGGRSAVQIYIKDAAFPVAGT